MSNDSVVRQCFHSFIHIFSLTRCVRNRRTKRENEEESDSKHEAKLGTDIFHIFFDGWHSNEAIMFYYNLSNKPGMKHVTIFFRDFRAVIYLRIQHYYFHDSGKISYFSKTVCDFCYVFCCCCRWTNAWFVYQLNVFITWNFDWQEYILINWSDTLIWRKFLVYKYKMWKSHHEHEHNTHISTRGWMREVYRKQTFEVYNIPAIWKFKIINFPWAGMKIQITYFTSITNIHTIHTHVVVCFLFLQICIETCAINY